MSGVVKKIMLMIIDLLIVFFANWASYSLRYAELYVPDQWTAAMWLAYALVAIAVFYAFGLYRTLLRYISVDLMWPVIKAVSLYSLIAIVLTYLSDINSVIPISRSALITQGLICLLLVSGVRYLIQLSLRGFSNKSEVWQLNEKSKKVLIYGAGEAGFQLAQGLKGNRTMNVLGFIDDDPDNQNRFISGLNVFSPESVEKLVRDYEVSEVLLALPSASRNERHRIITKLEPLPVVVRTLPSLYEIVEGKVYVEDIREVDIADLIGRSIIPPDDDLMAKNIRGKTVLVTGAGGSIGSELCRQISMLNPKKLVLLEQSEFNLYTIDHELDRSKVEYVSILGSVENEVLIRNICLRNKVQTIFHAAAYKHVPMVERNPFAGVCNNVFGTYNLARAAIKTNVENFVLISTDKAVNPTNIMGASKRCAELVLQAFNKRYGGRIRFVMVRFGNVLGSSGSVIPLFRKQIKQGGPVTLTHPEITRYFMTLSEAAQLVIQAGGLGRGGDVFVLDMGKPVKILDLVMRMIRLSGLTVKDKDTPDGDIEIKVTGLRAGEKLYEELLIGGDVEKTTHQRIMCANENYIALDELERWLDELRICIANEDEPGLRALFLEIIEGFRFQQAS